MSDTISAIATATGGGIGIVRVSGPRAEAIARALVPGLPERAESHRLYHGAVVDPRGGETVDEVLAVVMRAPRSYTGEDVVEIHGHGGAASLSRILGAALAAGARVAEPGEFTRRAFLAGKLDLAQAEAVADVVAARSERALRLAQAQLRGGLSTEVRRFLGRTVEILAEVEGRIDFPEESLDFVPARMLAEAARVLGGEVERLAATWARGRALTDGLDVVLVGRPNAGKSSLLNALAGEERALVDAAPGTTRDFLEAEVDLGGGVRAIVVDTAGEREPGEDVERRGMALARRRRQTADVAVLVVDGTAGWGAPEAGLVADLGRERVVVTWNKSDRAPAPGSLDGFGVVPAVATAPGGVDALRAALRARVDVAGDEATVTVTSARHRELLVEAHAALARAADGLYAGAAPELAAVDLRVAHERLRAVVGERVGESVLDAVFARFCLGK